MQRWWPLVLPLCFLLHLGEEVAGGFTTWASALVGAELTLARFATINVVGWSALMAGTVAGILVVRLRWLLAVIAALLLVNGVAHGIGTVVSGAYSPGVGTGLLLYVPVGGWALSRLRGELAAETFWCSVAVGALANVAVFALAFGGG